MAQVTLNKCPNSKGILIHTLTHESFNASCRTYSCPFCGPRKLKKLEKAIKNWISTQKVVRLWTFTMSTHIGKDHEQHYKIMFQAIKEVIRHLRRRGLRLSYIAVRETHQNGYCHVHMLVNQYVHWQELQKLYSFYTLKEAGKQDQWPEQPKWCNVHMEKIYTPNGISHYIAKYVSKQINQVQHRKYRVVYSKSQDIVLFAKRSDPNRKFSYWFFILGYSILDNSTDKRSREDYILDRNLRELLEFFYEVSHSPP